MTTRVVSLTADLLFASRIEAVLRGAGYAVETVEELSALESALASAPAAVDVLDLHAGPRAGAVVASAKDVPVLAFGRHTQPALLREARQAGCVDAVARSTFVEEMVALVARTVGAASAGDR